MHRLSAFRVKPNSLLRSWCPSYPLAWQPSLSHEVSTPAEAGAQLERLQ